MKIRTKFIGTLCLFIVLLTALILKYTFYQHKHATKSINNILNYQNELELVSQLELAISKVIMPANDYLIHGDEEEREIFLELDAEVNRLFDILDGMYYPTRIMAEEREMLSHLKNQYTSVKNISDIILNLPDPIDNEEGKRLMEEMDLLADNMLEDSKVFHRNSRIAVLAEIEVISAYFYRHKIVMLSVLAVVITIAIFYGLLLTRGLIIPIRRLVEYMGKVGRGDFSQSLDIKTKDEIGALAERFNWMTEELNASYYTINGYSKDLERMVEEKTLELKNTIEELQDSNVNIESAKKEWENTFDSISDLISIHDENFNIIKCNKALGLKYNARPEDLIGKKCYEVFHGSSKSHHSCPLARCKETLKPETEVIEEPHMGGVFHITSFPRYDKDGRFIGCVEICRDITKQRKIERQEKILRELSGRLGKTLNYGTISKIIFDYVGQIIPHDHTAIVSYDSNTRNINIFSVKNKGETLRIMKGAEMPLKDTPTYLAYKSKDIVYRPFEEIMKHRFPFDSEFIEKENIKRDVIIPLIIGGGVIGFLVLASRSIDATFFEEDNRPFLQKIANTVVGPLSNALLLEKIRKSETKYRTLFESVTDGIVFTDLEGNILDCNKEFLVMLGYSLEELKTKTYQDITPPKWHDMEERIVKNQIIERGYSDFYEKEYIRKDGTVFPISITAWLNKDEYGKAKGMWGIVRDITESKHAEENLIKSNFLLSSITEGTTDTVFIKDTSGRYIMMNSVGTDIIGKPIEQIIGKDDADLFPPDIAQKLRDNDRIVMTSRKPHTFEEKVQTREGDRVYFSAKSPYFDKNRDVIGIICISRDITERKLAEAKIRKQNETISAVNEVFKETLTCDTEKAIGSKCLSMAEKLTDSKFGFIGELNRQTGLFDTVALSNPGWDACEIPESKAVKLIKDMKIRGIDRSLLKDEKSRIVNDPASHPDRTGLPKGHPTITSFLGVPLKLNGRIFGMIGLGNKESGYNLEDQQAIETLSVAFVEAITRMRMEFTLRESEERLRTISDTANEGIIMVDNEGNISFWNKTAEEIFGYSNEEAVGNSIHDLVVPSNLQERFLKGFKEFKDTGQGPFVGKTVELTAIKKDGTEFQIEHSVSTVKLKDKWHAVGIIRDITERKQLERQLKTLYKMSSLGRLTAGVFHEVLNPLNIISSYTQLMLLKEEKGSEKERQLKQILEEVDRIVKITDSLLIFSRKGNENVECVEIHSFLEVVISIVEPDMKLRNIKFIRKFEEKLPEIMANRDELRQVFLNIIKNAGDAMPEGGKLTISTRRIEKREKTFVSIKFKDTGCGIKSNDIDKVFDPFFTRKKEGKGTGLGLSMSYGIIRNHRGEMSVNSKEGKGTTFTVDLPC